MTKDFSLNTLPYFTLAQVSLFYKDKKEASTLLSNRIRQKKVHKIREWIYISDEKYKEIVMSWSLTSFLEFAATHLIYTPSYLSLEYILFLNNIITENVYTFTLVTTKKTTTLSNSFWVFNYRSVKKDFYGDYIVVKKNWFTWYEATPEKALFDYLYLKRDFVYSEDYIEELRINRENVNMKKFENIIKKYKSRKMQNILILIKKHLWL